MMKLRNAEKMQRRSSQLKTHATYAIAKGKREKKKLRLDGIRTLTSFPGFLLATV